MGTLSTLRRWWLRLVWTVSAGWLAACTGLRSVETPIPTVCYADPTGVERTVVLLPGVRDTPSDFGRHGFPDLVAASGVEAAVVAVDAHLGYYRRRTVLTRLREDVVLPASRSGRDDTWLVGISLGGLGALLYASEHPDEVSGVVLLAPFLGEPEVIAEIEAAGGARAWQPPAGGSHMVGRRLWTWLAGYTSDDPAYPPIYLAYGADDRFATADGLLAELLPPERVLVAPGGHDWETWRELFAAGLARGWLQGE